MREQEVRGETGKAESRREETAMIVTWTAMAARWLQAYAESGAVARLQDSRALGHNVEFVGLSFLASFKILMKVDVHYSFLRW